MRNAARAPRRLLIAAAALVAIVPAAPASAAGARCAKADELPRHMTITEVRVSTLCLINAERRKRGLAPLRHDLRLALAGTRHVRDMVGARYFSHDSRGGRRFDTRIARTGYARGKRATVGENLAWGTGELATPRSIVRGWMNSPGHRANILHRVYREVGIAIAHGTPRSPNAGATYATEFGRRF
jgi:uncharacterized protein YkwD